MLAVSIRLFIIAIVSLFSNSVNSTPISALTEEEWSDLSDIVEINNFDPNWNKEVQSAIKVDKSTQKAANKTFQRPRISKEKRKEYRERFNRKVKSDPIKREIYKAKKQQWNTNWLSKLTSKEKEEYISRLKEKKRSYKLRERVESGGYASRKEQRLAEIRKMKANGTVSGEDLKFLSDYQAAERLRKGRRNLKKTL